MGLYLYAVVDGLAEVPRVRGVTSGPLRKVRAGRLWVVAGVAESGASPGATLEALRAHDRVVRRLWSSARAVVPFRFGALVQSQAELSRLLRPGEARLREALARTAGRAQMALRLVTDGAPVPEAEERTQRTRATGAAYLRGRLEREQRRREVPELAEVGAAAAPWVRAVKAQRAEGGGPLLATVFHLVDRADLRAYRRAVRAAATLPRGLRLIVSGPSPAYAFAPEGPL